MERDFYLAVFFILFVAVVVSFFLLEKNLLSPEVSISDQPECNDRIDIEGDGFIDYPADLECFSEIDISESVRGNCEEKWRCTSWSACQDYIQTRNCLDENDCGTSEEKPLIERNCGNPEKENEDRNNYSYFIIAISIVLLIIFFLIFENYKSKKDKEKISRRKKEIEKKFKEKIAYVGD
mgnify:CR=1 FL=1